MTDSKPTEQLPLDAPGTIAEYVEDIRTGILILAGALIKAGAIKPAQLHAEVQKLLDDVGGRALNPAIYPVLNKLACIEPIEHAPED